MKQEWIEWFAYKARRWLDRIDRAHAPKATGWSWTFEKGGIQFNQENRGAKVWYLDDSEYDRAWNESQTIHEDQSPVQIFNAMGVPPSVYGFSGLPDHLTDDDRRQMLDHMVAQAKEAANRDVYGMLRPPRAADSDEPQWNDIESPHQHLTDEQIKEAAKSQMRRGHLESTGHDIADMIDDFAGEGGLGMFQQIEATFGGIAEGTADARTDHQIDKAVGDIQSHAHRVILSRDDDGNPQLDS